MVVPGLKDAVQGSTCTMSSRPRVLAGGIDAQERNRRQTRERTHIDDVTSLLLSMNGRTALIILTTPRRFVSN